MRLLCTLRKQEEAESLSAILTRNGIDNRIEAEMNTDWGSPDYGTPVFRLWIVEEDQMALAMPLYEKYQQEPVLTPKESKILQEPMRRVKPPRKPLSQSVGPVTRYLIALCCLLFILSVVTDSQLKQDSNESYATGFSSPIKKEMLYDYPRAYEIISKLVSLFGVNALQSETPPPDAKPLLEELNHTPYWQGFYETIVSGQQTNAPLFEKLRQGEIWRLFSPIFLHGDLLHLLFNMLWLFVLGKQIEAHLGPARYLSFIFLAAAFTNTAQYLMGGPNFIGFSGVLCAMITYVYVRQRKAPWEGYQMQRSTFIFIMLFIFGMLGIQLISFVLQMTLGETLPSMIANTSHLSGAALGLLLGITPFFTREPRISR